MSEYIYKIDTPEGKKGDSANLVAKQYDLSQFPDLFEKVQTECFHYWAHTSLFHKDQDIMQCRICQSYLVPKALGWVPFEKVQTDEEVVKERINNIIYTLHHMDDATLEVAKDLLKLVPDLAERLRKLKK